MNQTLKIIVCYHKDTPYFQLYKNNPNIFIPVFGGKQKYTGTSQFILNMQGDNTGKNISKYNQYLSQFTQIYWLYNNYDKIGNPNYVGLFHYRRFMMDCFTLRPNIIYVYQQVTRFSLCTQYLFSAHNPQILYVTKLFLDRYLKNKTVQFKNFIMDVFSQKQIYYCNMFIMSKELFFEYGKFISECIQLAIELMKEIPQEFYKTSIINQKNELRLFGFILERMTCVFFYKMKKEKNIQLIPGNFHFIHQNGMITRQR